MNCAIYIRVSSEGQAIKGHSLEAQEKVGINICKQNGWEYEVFKEAGKSASKDNLDNRPVLQHILDLADDEKIDYCFVTEFDRLSRNLITLEGIKKVFRDNDVKVVTSSAVYDFKDEENEFIADLLGLLAKRENRVRVKRARRAILESLLKGNWSLGDRCIPFGYTKKNKKLIPHPEESKAFKMMVDWYIEGKGSKKIAKLLNSMGVKTKRASVGACHGWADRVITRMFKNPFFKGEHMHKGHKIAVPVLISPDKWQMLQDKLKANYRNGARHTKRFYLLKGLIYCKRCGRKLYGNIRPSCRQRTYTCASKRFGYEDCGIRSVNLDKINSLVWEKSMEIALNSSQLREAVISQQSETFVDGVEFEVQLKAIDQQIAKKKAEIKDVIRRKEKYISITDEDMDLVIIEIKDEMKALEEQKRALQDKICRVEKTRKHIQHVSDYLSTISSNIKRFDNQQRYEFLHLLIDKIEVEYNELKREHTVEIVYIIPLEEPTEEVPPIKELQRQW